MNIFLTGGSGRVGKAAVALLAERGHDVTVIGRSADVTLPGARYEQCDIMEYDRLESLMRGHDAVVHLAAIPDPIGNPGRALFAANDLGTFHVYEAAAKVGIRRVVSASSINALGYFFGDRSFPLPYAPVNEETPCLATDAYSFSKQVMERIGDYFWERDGISGVMLRLPGVFAHERVVEAKERGGASPSPLAQELLALPEDERNARLDRMHAAYDRHRRATRLDEMKRETLRELRRTATEDLSVDELSFMHHHVNMYVYIDELDSAHAIERGLLADYEGCHPIFVNAQRNDAGLPVAELVKLFRPAIPELRPQHAGDDCFVSIDRARELIGFDPEWAI